MNPCGVTTDGRCNILVYDVNNRCLQMFSISDGRYLGVLVKEEYLDLGELMCLGWCHTTSSLIVTHKNKDKSKQMISSVKIQ